MSRLTDTKNYKKSQITAVQRIYIINKAGSFGKYRNNWVIFINMRA